MIVFLRFRSFVRLELAKFCGSCRLRGFFLDALLKPLDIILEWLHLRLECEVLRLQGVALRFRFFKLTVERKHLAALLLSKRPSSSRVGDFPHELPPEI